MSHRRVESFLLRLVVEDEPGDPEQWRGRIQHVGSGDARQFRRLQDAIAFIRSQCEGEPLQAASPPSATDSPER